MHPVRLGARWSPAIHSRRPLMGQAKPEVSDILTVLVHKDGTPVSGVSVEIMLLNGDATTVSTDASGTVVLPYSTAQRGQAIVRVTPPADVEDLGEGWTQGVDLKGGPIEVKFELVGTGGSPLVGLGVAGVIYGLVLATL